jgi:hypothetical protein
MFRLVGDEAGGVAEGALAPAYAKRRSTPWQAGHRKVRCSKLGNVVGSAWTAAIRTISVLQNKHRIALNRSFINEVHGAHGAYCDQASRDQCP